MFEPWPLSCYFGKTPHFLFQNIDRKNNIINLLSGEGGSGFLFIPLQDFKTFPSIYPSGPSCSRGPGPGPCRRAWTTVTPSRLVCLQVPSNLPSSPRMQQIDWLSTCKSSWLPVAFLICFKTFIVAYCSENSSHSSYIQGLVKPYTPARALRSASASWTQNHFK